MPTYVTSTNLTDIRTPLLAYVTAITHDNAETQTLLQKMATYTLNKWADCQVAIANVNASAAGSYSNGLGLSINKRRLDELNAEADRLWEEFVRLCALGGQTVPSLADSVSYWDLSGQEL